MKKLKFRYLVIALQIVIAFLFFWFGLNLSPKPNCNFVDSLSVFKTINDTLHKVLSLEKSKGISWIVFNNFFINAIQSILATLTLGISGIFTLSKDCLVYGFTFQYTKSVFLWLEFLTSITSIILSTIISFDMYTKKQNVLNSLSKLSYIIIFSIIPLMIAALIEGNIVY